ncbi:MAG: amino acid adenylation domain-containing protein [Micrococcales bacterium]|nr:amino acid adenylation domain-containing protein [Micrococcales bacterium]
MTQAIDHPPITPAKDTRHLHGRHTRSELATEHAGASFPRPALQHRMYHYFESACDRWPQATALEWEGGSRTYAELDREANRLANYLLAHHLEPGSRVGLLIERSHLLYVALLGAQKTGASFVPIDPQTPPDRLTYFASDSGLDLLLTTSDLAQIAADSPAPVLVLDELEAQIAASPKARPQLELHDDPTAYVIYTSGSTGLPKGVDIAQSSICNFLYEITHLYQVLPGDRVYQGMTISFDFAIEEVWPTWAAGATLVAGPTDGRRVGEGLTTFLEDHAITLLYCVPTVLSTVERIVPSIRGLMVGGEACPAELVERWSPGRRMLNTYGPTEATVTCTVGELHPGRAVTIGVAVPTYTAYILDDRRHPLPGGEVGELAIGGIGVARGYLNRADLTADRFIAHPTDPQAGRIYRTGDLARIQEDGEIVYLGRADAEVKIRGHRVDLGEIESVMMRDADVPTAAVKHLTSPDRGDELAAYVVVRQPERADEVLARLYQDMRNSLPPYMVPVYMERVDELPMLTSGKVNRKALPNPSTPRLLGGSTGEVQEPESPEEEWLRSEWAAMLHIEEDALSVTADFFDDLAGHSLVAATLTSRLRKDPRAASMSVLDLYANPSIRALAQRLVLSALDAETSDAAGSLRAPEPRAARPRGWRVAAFGAAQFGFVFALILLTFSPIAMLYWWHEGVPSMLLLQHLAIAFPLTYLAERWLLPLAVARVAGWGLTPGTYPLYGPTHLRIWLVEKALTLSPLNNLAGSAFAAGYLRAAGATIGDGCHIGTTHVPLPSMLVMGDGATVGYASHLQGYSIRDGRLTLGRVVLDEGATVAGQVVMVGPCRLGARSLLSAQSALRAGQDTGPGEVWEGSPAVRMPGIGDPIIELMASCDDAPVHWSSPLKQRFIGGLLALELTPLAALVPAIVLVWSVLLAGGDGAALVATLFTGPLFVISSCLIILWLRRFGLPHTPIGVRHLRSGLGVDKWFADKLLETSLMLTNSLYATLYTPPWLRRLGAHIGKRAEVSTIANIDPDLLTVGDESFVADMANVGGATYCNHHVAFRPTVVGTRAFGGNAAFVPSGSHLGDDSLLGVGSVPPPSGVRAGSSWLGSPSIFLPRREVFEEYGDDVTFAPSRGRVIERYLIEGLRIVLPATLLALSTFGTLYLASLFAEAEAELWQMLLVVPTAAMLCGLGTVLVVALLKWLIVGRYRPRVEPLWSRFVRRTEFVTGIYEAAAVPALLTMLTGTPLLGPVLRLFGVKVGRRSLINTTYITEFDLVRLGDDVAIDAEVSLQTHLFEDRVMKMNTIEIGDRVEVATRSVVLYSTVIEDDAHLAPLSLVMKGESLPAATSWVGIPAQQATRSDQGIIR